MTTPNQLWATARANILARLLRKVPAPAPPKRKVQATFASLRPGQWLADSVGAGMWQVVAVDNLGATVALAGDPIEIRTLDRDWREAYSLAGKEARKLKLVGPYDGKKD